MCGISPTDICKWSEALLPGHIGFTKQLVFRIALPHITLLFIAIFYALFGCAILSAFDYNSIASSSAGADEGGGHPWENQTNLLEQHLKILQRNFATNVLLNEPKKALLGSSEAFDDQFTHFAINLYHIHEQQQYLKKMPPNFHWNLFYSTTWLASIGYGQNAPRTIGRRIFCMFYLTFGIPLYLVTLADLAKFCTEAINRFYTECIKVHFQFRQRYRRRNTVANGCHSAGVGAEMDDDDDVILTTGGRQTGQEKVQQNGWPIRKTAKVLQGNEEEMAEFLWKYLEKTYFVEVPFAVVYLFLLGYIVGASYIVAYLEDWTIWDGFYFIIMSVLTIGFGDIVPKNSDFILIILFVIIIGLIFTTTFIDMIGAYYIDRLHFFGRRVDIDDPLEWLKSVQQRRIEAMKREAMRRLFETVTAMWHFRVLAPTAAPFGEEEWPPAAEQPPAAVAHRINEILPPPRGIVAFHVTADSVTLKWEPPLHILLGSQKFWYMLSIKPRTPQKMNTLKIIDFIRQNRYVIHGLKSFTLYEFNVQISTKDGTSRPARCQEYTEPCTVPQLLELCAISSVTATIAWHSPKKNHGTEQYFLLFAQEPAPQFQYWRRYEIGRNKRFTLTDLDPDTKYVVCVFAAHNFGFAAMSRTLRFKTRSWWFQEEEQGQAQRSHSNKCGNSSNNFLALPTQSAGSSWAFAKARRPSLREPTICGGGGGGGGAKQQHHHLGMTSTASAAGCGGAVTAGGWDERAETATPKSSLQSGEYQDTT